MFPRLHIEWYLPHSNNLLVCVPPLRSGKSPCADSPGALPIDVDVAATFGTSALEPLLDRVDILPC